MIKLLLLDIDGVLTDGKVTVDSHGNEYKTLDFKDIDAVFELKRQGVLIGLITGEDTPITLHFKERLKPDIFYKGCKDKAKALNEILTTTKLSADQVCFIGDSKHDIPAMQAAGLSACPGDAMAEVKAVARVRLNSSGGNGCVRELLSLLKQ